MLFHLFIKFKSMLLQKGMEFSKFIQQIYYNNYLQYLQLYLNQIYFLKIPDNLILMVSLSNI